MLPQLKIPEPTRQAPGMTPRPSRSLRTLPCLTVTSRPKLFHIASSRTIVALLNHTIAANRLCHARILNTDILRIYNSRPYITYVSSNTVNFNRVL